MVVLPSRVQYRRCVTLISLAAVVSEPKLHQVREPLDKIDPNNQHMDAWEVILYMLALSYSLDSESSVLLPKYIL